MAINKNHLFDDLNGIKCAIVETEVPTDRVNFLKSLLEFNKFTVVVIPSPPPKGTPAPAVTPTDDVPAISNTAFNKLPTVNVAIPELYAFLLNL